MLNQTTTAYFEFVSEFIQIVFFKILFFLLNCFYIYIYIILIC